jgi:hypothetical protein
LRLQIPLTLRELVEMALDEPEVHERGDPEMVVHVRVDLDLEVLVSLGFHQSFLFPCRFQVLDLNLEYLQFGFERGD